MPLYINLYHHAGRPNWPLFNMYYTYINAIVHQYHLYHHAGRPNWPLFNMYYINIIYTIILVGLSGHCSIRSTHTSIPLYMNTIYTIMLVVQIFIIKVQTVENFNIYLCQKKVWTTLE